jgi:hypothetical protein
VVHAYISILRSRRQEDQKFKASLGYIAKHVSKNQNQKKKKKPVRTKAHTQAA